MDIVQCTKTCKALSNQLDQTLPRGAPCHWAHTASHSTPRQWLAVYRLEQLSTKMEGIITGHVEQTRHQSLQSLGIAFCESTVHRYGVMLETTRLPSTVHDRLASTA